MRILSANGCVVVIMTNQGGNLSNLLTVFRPSFFRSSTTGWGEGGGGIPPPP